MDRRDADREQLENRVAELEETVSKMLPNRRGVLKGLGAAAVGGAAVGASTGGASGQSAAGQVGTENAPVDVEGAQGNFNSVSAEVGPNKTFNAGSHSGANGYEKIQNALDAADSALGINKVVVGGDGPDDLSTHDPAEYDRGYLLTQSLEIGSNTILEIDSYVFLESGADDNLIRNKDRANGNSNIVIRGDGTVDANGDNQTTFNRQTTDCRKNLGIRLINVSNVDLRNLTVKRTNGWAILINGFQDVDVENLTFEQTGNTPNADGVDLAAGSGATVSDIDGVCGDDPVALGTSDPHEYPEVAGNIEDVQIDNVSCRLVGGDHHQVRISASDADYQAQNITVNNVSNPDGNTRDLVRIGSDYANRNIENITVSNLTADFCRALTVRSQVDRLSVSNVTITGGTIGFAFPENVFNSSFSNISAREVGRVFSIDPGTAPDHATLEFSGISVEKVGQIFRVKHPVKGFDVSDITTYGDTVTVVEANDAISQANISDLDVRNADYVLDARNGSIAGVASDWFVEESNIGSAVYGGLSNLSLKFSGALPAFDSAPPHVSGSEVVATATWDPDGDGNGEKVISDGASWNEIADMPNI